MKRKLPVILLIGLILTSVWQIADNISAQDRPLTLAEILTGLQTQEQTAETRTLAARNKFIAQRVRQRGVSFALTKEREKDLRDAGATNELIKAIRKNSPALPTPTPTPTHYKNSIGMEFVRIPSGTFMMGSSRAEINKAVFETKKYNENAERGWFAGESPKRKVTIKDGFWLGRYEVTQAEWQAIMGDNPSYFKDCGGNCPVEQVSWDDIQVFLKRLNAKNDGFEYRLPSEAEWEYAARAGTTTAFSFGNSLNSNQANFFGFFPYASTKGPEIGKTVKVGSYQPNAFGLYDMHGNVWEWVEDIYSLNYRKLPTDGSANVSVGDSSRRVLRGGAWNDIGSSCRSAFRNEDAPASRNSLNGFRIVARAKSH